MDHGTFMKRNPLSPARCSPAPSPPEKAGFTMIELMVVMAIITLAFGIMVPSVTEFFRNRQLDLVRQQFNSALNAARLQAVVNNRPFYVVFFREGIRVYDPKLERWKVDEEFDPETAPAGDEAISFNLLFAGRHGAQLLRYLDWEASRFGGTVDKKGAGSDKDEDKDGPKVTLNDVKGLVKIAFDRDGSLSFVGQGGQDVPAASYKADPPQGADIIIWQSFHEHREYNPNVAFIDLQPTGTVKSRIASGQGVEKYRQTGGKEEESRAQLVDEGPKAEPKRAAREEEKPAEKSEETGEKPEAPSEGGEPAAEPSSESAEPPGGEEEKPPETDGK